MSDLKKRLEASVKTSAEVEEWQMGEIEAAIRDLDAGHAVEHNEVAAWMESWGEKRERKSPK